jgi:hypothetical protein
MAASVGLLPVSEKSLRETSRLVEATAELDLTDLSGLESVFQIGRDVLDVWTTEGREVRITAKRDLGTGQFHAEYERRTTVGNGANSCRVWAATSAHLPSVAVDAQTCLQGALEEVNKLHIY